jgi:hypothetical protein
VVGVSVAHNMRQWKMLSGGVRTVRKIATFQNATRAERGIIKTATYR